MPYSGRYIKYERFSLDSPDISGVVLSKVHGRYSDYKVIVLRENDIEIDFPYELIVTLPKSQKSQVNEREENF